jgi:hypothetical protein
MYLAMNIGLINFEFIFEKVTPFFCCIIVYDVDESLLNLLWGTLNG